MTSKDRETNGASLEDCQTNVFVLTELNGLKWKKFVTPIDQSSRGCSEVSDDPILRAYGRCLSEGLLAVWRRAPARDRATVCGQVDLRLAAEKELWVFWYQDEPELLKTATSALTNPDDDGRGNWQTESGIGYETRILLFKALHNLIERFLIIRGFVRLGRFFVQPLDPDAVLADQTPSSYVLGFYFSFFVHGDNNVCVSVNTQRQPAVYRLAKRHLSQPMGSGNKQSVVLAPWSLAASINTASPFSQHLLGETPTDSSSIPTSQLHQLIRRAEAQWKEWSNFYPLPIDNIENLGYVDPVEKERQERAKAMALPKMVEVTVAGVRMYYPTCMVTVLANDDAKVTSHSQHLNTSSGSVRSPQKHKSCSSPQKVHPSPPSPPIPSPMSVSGCQVAGKASEEIFIAGRKPPPSTTPSGFDGISDPSSGLSTGSTNADEPRWDFEDPCEKHKQMCGCRLQQSSKQRVVLNKAQQKFFSHEANTRLSRQSFLSKIINSPFHRRSPLTINAEDTCIIPQTPVEDVGEQGPSSSIIISTCTGLPPHEPVTQMISPVPPPSISLPPDPPDTSECKRLTDDKNHVQVEEPVYSNAITQSTLSVPSSFITYQQVPHANVLSTPQQSFSLHPKKPKLDQLDRLSMATQMGENFRFVPLSNDLFGINSHAWCEHPELQPFNATDPPTQPQPIQHFISSDDCDKVKADATANEPLLRDKDLLPEKCLPDDFLSQVKTECSSPETRHNEMVLMSPPNSNEHAGRMPPPPVPHMGSVGSLRGPPSNEYIYPTPPSLEPNLAAQQCSPESLHTTHIQPERPKPFPLHMSPIVTSSYSTDCNRSVLVATPPALLNTVTVSSTNQTLCFDDTPLADKDCAVYPNPQIAKYLASSKFYGTIESRRKRAISDMPAVFVNSELEYKPSRAELKCLDMAVPSKLTPHHNSSFSRQMSTPIGSPVVSSGGVLPRHSTMPCQVPSPAYAGAQPATRGRTPSGLLYQPPSVGPIVDLQSPLSNAPSTPYNRTLNSVEQVQQVNSCSVGPPGLGVPEAHSLVLTLLLSDTFVDLHRDASFDSCPICACEPANLNILGEEAGVYVPTIPPTYPTPTHGGALRCSCGFSAVRYRYLSSQAGLFDEDEQEATPLSKHVPLNDKHVNEGNVDADLIELIRAYSLVRDMAPEVSQSYKLYQACATSLMEPGTVSTVITAVSSDYYLSALETDDLSQLCNSGMEAACMVMDCTTPSKSDFEKTKSEIIERWGFLRAMQQSEPTDNESLSLFDTLFPILQDSLRKPIGVYSANRAVSGPLTWRGLERKCIRTSKDEDACQPEPVPRVIVTMDKDYVTVSPVALKLWDRLLLEPHCQPKDVVFLGLIPDTQLIVTRARSFFRELSKVYENMRFGRHIPYTKLHSDGLVRVGTEQVRRLLGHELDPWFDKKLPSEVPVDVHASIKAYALMCRQYLSTLLKGAFDRQIMRDTGKENQRPTGSETMPPPATPSSSTTDSATDATSGDVVDPDNDLGILPHTVVIYLVNPFVFGSEHSSKSIARLSYLALMRCYLELLRELSPNQRPHVHLEMISLRTLLDSTAALSSSNIYMRDYDASVPHVPLNSPYMSWITNPARQSQAQETLKNLALSVLSHSRSLTAEVLLSGSQAKCLTGFGPASARCMTIQRHIKESSDASTQRTYRVYCSPFLLAPSGWQRPFPLGEQINFGAPGSLLSMSSSSVDEASVILISYCLSEEQRWLLATATDQQGSMLDSTVINLDTVQRRDLALPGELIKHALEKLWSFIVGMLATGCRPWRLVVCRLGRIGHGELKVWCMLLNKKNLLSSSRQLKDSCPQCSQMPSFHETPAIVAACLISTEPEAGIRVFPSVYEHDSRFGQAAKQCNLSTPHDASCTHILVFPTSANASGQQSMPTVLDEDDGGMDWMNLGVGLDDTELGEVDLCDFNDAPSSSTQESCNQQPLAMGYYISTAPAAGLPGWFWVSCPAARNRCPAHLRASLHIHTKGVQEREDDLLSHATKVKTGTHPLDSRLTTDVLRYVLETFNALSWLHLDLSTGDRLSCLPVHIQALLRLYHSTSTLLHN